MLHPIGAHGLHHLRQQGCGGIGVHIDSAHGGVLPPFDCKGNLYFLPTHRQGAGKVGRRVAWNEWRLVLRLGWQQRHGAADGEAAIVLAVVSAGGERRHRL